MNIKDFKVGQTVYVELTGNASRGKTIEECIEEWEVTSVGRKYIKAVKKDEKVLRIEIIFEWREEYKSFVEKTNYSINYTIYNTREEIENKHERRQLFKEISEIFRFGTKKVTLEQLRKIKEILEGSDEEKC